MSAQRVLLIFLATVNLAVNGLANDGDLGQSYKPIGVTSNVSSSQEEDFNVIKLHGNAVKRFDISNETDNKTPPNDKVAFSGNNDKRKGAQAKSNPDEASQIGTNPDTTETSTVTITTTTTTSITTSTPNKNPEKKPEESEGELSSTISPITKSTSEIAQSIPPAITTESTKTSTAAAGSEATEATTASSATSAITEAASDASEGPQESEVAEKPKDEGMSSGIIALVMAIVFAVVVILVYVGLLLWRRYLEFRYGNRELLVNDLEFDTNDLRHFEL